MTGLKRSLRRKLVIGVPKSDQSLIDDPYLRLGYGMNSYFQIIIHLMIMMSLLMVLSIPLMIIYASYNDLEHLTEYNWNQFALGNMGGSDSLCISSNFNQENEKPILLQCSTGVISLDIKTEKTGEPIFDAGIIPSSSEVNNYCNSAAFEDLAKCSNLIEKGSLKVYIDKQCAGKKECKLTDLASFVDTSTHG